MDEQGAPSKTETQKRKHADGGNRERQPGRNTEILAEHAEMPLGKPKPTCN